jgi:ferredoxin-NADP reductase
MAWLDYPYGSFTTDGADTGPWVFLAAGIGISPFLAMASDKLRDDARVLILWAARTRDDLAGFEELAALNARRPSIRMIPVLGHDPLWSGRHGRLDRQTLEELASRELADPEARYWICCPAPLRKALVKALKNLGVPGKHIRCEVFSQ